MRVLLEHASFVRSVARAALAGGGAADVDDVVQETWLAALRSPPRRAGRVRAWLAAVVRRRAARVIRDRQRQRRRVTGAARGADPALAPATVDLAERVEMGRHLAALVLALPDPYRRVVLLRYHDGLSPGEVAERLGVPLETARTRLRRGLALLRREIAAEERRLGRPWRSAWLPALAFPARSLPVGATGMSIGTTLGVTLVIKRIVFSAVLLGLLLGAGWLALGPWLARRDATEGHPPDLEAAGAGDTGPVLVGRAQAVPAEDVALDVPAEHANDEDASSAASLPVVGRVVDERRFPVAGAHVLAQAGEARCEGITDADGSFRLVAPWPPGLVSNVVVSAREGRARRAVGVETVLGSSFDMRRQIDVGTLVLRTAEDLEVLVRDADGPVAGAEVRLVAVAMWTAPAFAEARSDATGTAHLGPVPHGLWRVMATAPGRGRGSLSFRRPSATQGPVLITLGPPRSLDVLVVDRESGEPVRDATVLLWEVTGAPGVVGAIFAPYVPPPDLPPTDDKGRLRIEGLGAEDAILLFATAPGYPQIPPTHMVARPVPTNRQETTLKLQALHTVSWPLGPGECPAPAEGNAVALLPYRPGVPHRLPETARIVEGRIVASGLEPGDIDAWAVAPDGCRARLRSWRNASEGEATSFVRPRRLEVVLHESDGAPVTGLQVGLCAAGEFPFDAVAVDGNGRVVFDGLDVMRFEAFLSAPNQRGPATHPLGTADLTEGDARLDVTLPPRVPVRLALTVAGRPALPASYTLQVGAETVRPSEDPAAGVLAFVTRPKAHGPSRTIRLYHTGFLPVEITVPQDAGPEGVTLHAALVRGGTLAAHVILPREVRLRVTLERHDSEADTWRMVAGHVTLPLEPDPETGVADVVLDELEAGRYRLAASDVGLASEVAEVRQEERAVAISFDLHSVGYVRGRVEVPDGIGPQDAHVVVEFPDRVSTWSPFREAFVGYDGTFEVLVPGDREVLVRPTHPRLVPARDGGTANASAPRDGLRLRLVQTTEAVFRLSPPEDGRPGRRISTRKELPVRLYAPGFAGEGRACDAVFADDAWRFAGFEPGEYAVWIDVSGWVPVRRDAVRLGEGSVDLGRFVLERGAEVRIRVHPVEGQAVPSLAATATRLEGGFPYERDAWAHGESELTIPGLLPGRWNVRVTLSHALVGPGQGGSVLDRDVVVEGDAPVDLELDLASPRATQR